MDELLAAIAQLTQKVDMLQASLAARQFKLVYTTKELAEALGTNRQSLVSSLLTESLTEAIQGYASVFTSPREVVQELLAGTDLFYQAVWDAKDSKQGGNE